MKPSTPADWRWAATYISAAKSIILGIVITTTVQTLIAKPEPRDPVGIVSDWTHHHLLYPDPGDGSSRSRFQDDPRSMHSWYLRHHEAWWPQNRRRHQPLGQGSSRDWNIPLAAVPSPYGFQPAFNYTFSI